MPKRHRFGPDPFSAAPPYKVRNPNDVRCEGSERWTKGGNGGLFTCRDNMCSFISCGQSGPKSDRHTPGRTFGLIFLPMTSMHRFRTLTDILLNALNLSNLKRAVQIKTPHETRREPLEVELGGNDIRKELEAGLTLLRNGVVTGWTVDPVRLSKVRMQMLAEREGTLADMTGIILRVNGAGRRGATGLTLLVPQFQVR